jgi:hypothetical protein
MFRSDEHTSRPLHFLNHDLYSGTCNFGSSTFFVQQEGASSRLVSSRLVSSHVPSLTRLLLVATSSFPDSFLLKYTFNSIPFLRQLSMTSPKPRLYFAYGSNLSLTQMSSRCPTSTYHSFGILHNYRWIIGERGYANVVSSPPSNTTSGEVYATASR